MNDDFELKAIILVGLVMSAIGLRIGYVKGADHGYTAACQSVHLEWVKDKCMKVTREELK